MAGERIGVAMLGAGHIAEYHLAGLASVPRADVRLVVGRTRERAEALAKRFGIQDVATSVEAALGRDDVHAVIIATPDDTHEPIAVAAARAGKAILLQKPMAGSVDAAERIVAEAVQQGVDLQVSFMHRDFEEVVLARQWLEGGALGPVFGVRIRNATPGPDWDRWFFRKASVPNGVADQLGVHGIDLVEHLVGHVRNVSARARTALPRRRLRDGTLVDVETIDNVSATYELDHGALVTHEMSMTEVAGCDRFRMEIYGEKGTIWLRTERGRFAAAVPERNGARWHVPELPDTPFGQRQHAQWLAGVAGAAPRRTTALDALRGMRIVRAIVRSSERRGEGVDVADAASSAAAARLPGERA